MGKEGSAVALYRENPKKFETKRQASKYLNHYGKVWKEEHNIPLTDPKRTLDSGRQSS